MKVIVVEPAAAVEGTSIEAEPSAQVAHDALSPETTTAPPHAPAAQSVMLLVKARASVNVAPAVAARATSEGAVTVVIYAQSGFMLTVKSPVV